MIATMLPISIGVKGIYYYGGLDGLQNCGNDDLEARL